MIFTAAFFLPFKNLSYLQQYFNNVDQICKHQNRRKIFQLYLIKWIFLLQFIRYALLYLLPLNHNQRFLLVDVMYLANTPLFSNLIISVVCLMLYDFCRLLYLNNNNRLTDLLRAVLFDDHIENTFFLHSNINNKPIGVYVRKVTLVALSMFQSLILFSLVWSFVQQFRFIIYLSNEEWSLQTILKIIFFEFNLLSYIIFITALAHVCSLMNMLGLAITVCIFIKLKQLNTVLYFPLNKRRTKHNSAIVCVMYFIKHHTEVFRLVSIGNPIYGKALVSVILTNLLLNSVLCTHMITRNINIQSRLLITTTIIDQLFCIVGNHYLAAKYQFNLHYPAKRLMFLQTRIHFKSIRQHWKFASYAQLIHTKNRYGIGYGIYQLITMKTFFKQCLIYSRFILILFKLLIIEKSIVK